MNNEIISSMIISDVDIIGHIYTIIKNAGIKTVNAESVKAKQSSTCVSKANTIGSNRFNCKYTDDYTILYDANDIMIVGGAALNIYDYLLSGLKMRKEFGQLEQYIKKKTSDIDIVWWPRVVIDKRGNTIESDIVVSKSDAIAELANTFKDELQKQFNENKELLHSKIKNYIKNIGDVIEVDVGVKPTLPAGVWNINISFKIKGEEYKLCDVIIHDSGSSQQYDFNGNEITTLQYMSSDSIYSTPKQGFGNSISYLNVIGTYIALPNIQSFVKQQMLAFSNLIDKRDLDKGFINYKRVEFIKKILTSLNVSDTKNKTDLLEVFKTDNMYYPQTIINEINVIENTMIRRLSSKILKLCSTSSNTNDTIVKELCIKAENILKPVMPIKPSVPPKSVSKIHSDLANEMKEELDRKLGIKPKSGKKSKSSSILGKMPSMTAPVTQSYYPPQIYSMAQQTYPQQQPYYPQQTYPQQSYYPQQMYSTSQPSYYPQQMYSTIQQPYYPQQTYSTTQTLPTQQYEPLLHKGADGSTLYRDSKTGKIMTLNVSGKMVPYMSRGGNKKRNRTKKQK
jgi:hypothetical protein